jgi:hypothetical protein
MLLDCDLVGHDKAQTGTNVSEEHTASIFVV